MGNRTHEELIVRHLPLARALALRYARGSEPLDDLVQVASLGLVKASRRWDPERGVSFATYAVPTILGELRRHFRDSTWAIRPPRDVQELCLLIWRAREPLLGEVRREPTAADLARRLGRSRDQVEAALRAAEARSLASLDVPSEGEEGGAATVGEKLGRDDEGYEQAEARATLERLTAILDERAREILRLRFQEDLLQSEIAARVGVSQVHVCRILRASLAAIAESLTRGGGAVGSPAAA